MTLQGETLSPDFIGEPLYGNEKLSWLERGVKIGDGTSPY
jgi:hypothetical protein